MLHSLTPPQGRLKEIPNISPKIFFNISFTSRTPRHKKLKTSFKKSNPNKKVMSDTNECCVCYEPTEHLAPCNHLVCESYYSQVPTCPMCRAPLGNGSIEEGSSEEEEDSDFDIDESNQGMLEAAFFGHFDIVHLTLFRGANNYNTGFIQYSMNHWVEAHILNFLSH